MCLKPIFASTLYYQQFSKWHDCDLCTIPWQEYGCVISHLLPQVWRGGMWHWTGALRIWWCEEQRCWQSRVQSDDHLQVWVLPWWAKKVSSSKQHSYRAILEWCVCSCMSFFTLRWVLLDDQNLCIQATSSFVYGAVPIGASIYVVGELDTGKLIRSYNRTLSSV